MSLPFGIAFEYYWGRAVRHGDGIYGKKDGMPTGASIEGCLY